MKNNIYNNKGYLKYDRLSIYDDALYTFIWVSIASFIIVVKGNVGETMLPVMESLVFLIGLLGVRVAFTTMYDYRFYTIINSIVGVLFSISLLGVLYTYPIYTGYVLYMLIILNSLLSPILNEKKRNYEDIRLINTKYKNVLSTNRKKAEYLRLVSGSLGAVTSVVIITGLNIDIFVYTKLILLLDLVASISLLYKAIKYLR